MEKQPIITPDLSTLSLSSTIFSGVSTRFSAHFQYDVLSEKEIRLFLLDLNGEGEPLSGSLMTTYHIWNEFDLKVVKEYQTAQATEAVMKKMTKSKKYDTFSYSWRDQRETFPLRLSRISNKLGPQKELKLDYESYRNGTIQIGTNLKNLLEELRRRKHHKFIWIDAICINQANELEKRTQIPLMRNIYEYSDDGYVWFGKGQPEEVMAVKMLPAVTEKLKKAADGGSSLNPAKAESFTNLGLPSPDDQFWPAIRTILKNPWWSRLWTLQEVVVPQKEGKAGFWSDFPATIVFLSDATIELERFMWFSVAAATLNIRPWIITGSLSTRTDSLYAFDSLAEIHICRESWIFNFRGVRLAALLLGTRRRKATFDGDAVYGMLAMMDSYMSELLAPAASSSVQEVFIKFAKHYVRNEHREHLFSHVATEERIEGLPSWCPNFASSPSHLSLGSRWFGRIELTEDNDEQLFHAGYKFHGKFKLPKKKVAALKYIANGLRGRNMYDNIYDTKDPRQISPLPDSDCIIACGIHMDIVAEFVDCNPATYLSSFFTSESTKMTQLWESQCLQLAMKHMSRSEESFEAYARTLAANRASVNFSAGRPILFDHEETLDFLDFYRQFKDYIQTDLSKDDSQAEDKLKIDAWHYMDVISHITRGRKFFATEGGRIGLGPDTLEVGDAVCVLFFCPTPYILRHFPNGRSRLVGEAYVHGLMYGQAIDMFEKKQIDETKWVIE